MFLFFSPVLVNAAFVCLAFSLAGASDEDDHSRFAYDHQMLDKIVKVEQKVELMDKTLKDSLESFLAILQYRKEEMQTQISTLGDSLTERLKTNLTRKVDAKLSELSQTEQLLTQKLSTLDGYIKEQVDFPRKLEEFKKEIQETIRVPKIAFTAINPSSSTYSANQVLILRDTSLNEGSGYNGATGEFTAPLAGMYLFTAHICSYLQNGAFIAIVVGSKDVAHSGHYDQDNHVCSSVSAVTYVQKGENVFLKATYTTKLYSDSFRQSSFTGVRISN